MRKIVDDWADVIIKTGMLAVKIAMLNNNSFIISYAVVRALMIHKQIASNCHTSGTPIDVADSQLPNLLIVMNSECQCSFFVVLIEAYLCLTSSMRERKCQKSSLDLTV
jgi:hypothetical protein